MRIRKYPLTTILTNIISITSLLLITQTAHADFRKALDAYQARDGDTMLKEAKDAVDNKNNDGLMLFLQAMSIDANTSVKSNLYEEFKDKRQTKSTLSTILTRQQCQELFDLLTIAINNSSIDTQYFFAYLMRNLNSQKQADTSKTNADYAKNGSYVAHYSSTDLANKAEAGDPFSQLRLGLQYLNFVDYAGYGCEQISKEAICQTKDETKGYYWLKQSLINYETRGHDDMSVYAGSMCDLLQQNPKAKKKDLRQAYLWCLVGINSGDSYSWRLLGKMQQSGKLKVAAPEVDALWESSTQQDKDKIFKMLNLNDFKELPDWVIETRKELAQQNLPVFSYYVDDYMQYELDLYRDGRVNIGFGSLNNGYPGHELGNISFVDTKKDSWMKVSPEKVNEFLMELKKLGFYDWALNNNASGFCDNFDATRCLSKRYQITVRDGVKARRVHLRGLAGFVNTKSDTTLRLAKISNLVEKYFPTQNLRCDLGGAEEYKQACLQRDSLLTILTNERN